MAIIIDPDNLVLGTDIVIDTTNKTFEIKTTSAVSNAGSTGGVRGQTLYSWFKEQWHNSATLNKYKPPMLSITDEQFEFYNGWKPKDDTTRNLIRSAGWAEKDASGVIQRKYMGVVSLGSIGDTDQPYFSWNGGAKTNFAFTGPVNQAVQIYGDAANGNFDYSDGGDTFTIFVREPGKTYASYDNIALGALTLTYKVYGFPLSNGVDLNISASDAVISSTPVYQGIHVEYFGTDQLRNIDGSNSAYRIVVTDTTGTATTKQIYEKIQYLLRQNSDIDNGAGSKIGAVASAIVEFVGATLKGAQSVVIDGLNSNFLNSVEFYDKNGAKHTYPFVAAGTINFGSQAGSGDFKYWMYFSNGFDTAGAILVQDKDGNPIEGTYTGSPVNFTFAYDTNTQGGRTAGTDASIKLVGLGLAGGQYIDVDTSITRSAGQSILLAPAQERNYINP